MALETKLWLLEGVRKLIWSPFNFANLTVAPFETGNHRTVHSARTL